MSGAGRVRWRLAQGHLDTQGPGIETGNLSCCKTTALTSCFFILLQSFNLIRRTANPPRFPVHLPSSLFRSFYSICIVCQIRFSGPTVWDIHAVVVAVIQSKDCRYRVSLCCSGWTLRADINCWRGNTGEGSEPGNMPAEPHLPALSPPLEANVIIMETFLCPPEPLNPQQLLSGNY